MRGRDPRRCDDARVPTRRQRGQGPGARPMAGLCLLSRPRSGRRPGQVAEDLEAPRREMLPRQGREAEQPRQEGGGGGDAQVARRAGGRRAREGQGRGAGGRRGADGPLDGGRARVPPHRHAGGRGGGGALDGGDLPPVRRAHRPRRQPQAARPHAGAGGRRPGGPRALDRAGVGERARGRLPAHQREQGRHPPAGRLLLSRPRRRHRPRPHRRREGAQGPPGGAQRPASPPPPCWGSWPGSWRTWTRRGPGSAPRR